MSTGKVYLVGAGPGDPELLTLKGQRVLSQADCVLFDHLASEDLLKLAPSGAERIYVGKKKSEHAFSQDEISAMLIDRARAGRIVVRLKGGDPYMFGRGGEEAEALADAGIAFEVVPGVTSPLGIAAYCGVPLTHRDHTSVVTFLTGHEVDRIEWSKVSGAETLVVFMGLTVLESIVRRLIENGRDPNTPAIAVRWATRPDQQTVAAPLQELPQAVKAAQMKPPATVVIGAVAALREKLDWFQRLPLFGQTVLVTRAAEQAGELSVKLHDLGARVIEWPTIALCPPANHGPIDAAIAELESFDWVLFTSANGVRFFMERLERSPKDLRALRGKLCAIGPATKAALERLHLKVDLMPAQYVAESVVAAFTEVGVKGKRILLPRAAVARDVIPRELGHLGATVEVVEAYRTVAPPEASLPLPVKPDWATFTSSSTVKNFTEAQGVAALSGVRIATIGPITSQTAREAGLAVDAEGSPYTIDGMLAALVGRRSTLS